MLRAHSRECLLLSLTVCDFLCQVADGTHVTGGPWLWEGLWHIRSPGASPLSHGGGEGWGSPPWSRWHGHLSAGQATVTGPDDAGGPGLQGWANGQSADLAPLRRAIAAQPDRPRVPLAVCEATFRPPPSSAQSNGCRFPLPPGQDGPGLCSFLHFREGNIGHLLTSFWSRNDSNASALRPDPESQTRAPRAWGRATGGALPTTPHLPPPTCGPGWVGTAQKQLTDSAIFLEKRSRIHVGDGIKVASLSQVRGEAGGVSVTALSQGRRGQHPGPVPPHGERYL